MTEMAQSAFEKGKRYYESQGDVFSEEIRKTDLFIEPVRLVLLKRKKLPNLAYVINTWNIALLSFLTTDNFRDCVLNAVNMVSDTDTNGSVAGLLPEPFTGRNPFRMNGSARYRTEGCTQIIRYASTSEHG